MQGPEKFPTRLSAFAWNSVIKCVCVCVCVCVYVKQIVALCMQVVFCSPLALSINDTYLSIACTPHIHASVNTVQKLSWNN